MPDTPAKQADNSPAGRAKKLNNQRRPDQNEPDVNRYYAAAAKNFRHAKHASILLLIAFLVFSIAFNRNEITIDNLQYLMKFISFTNTETSISATKINYSSADKIRLSLFLGDLCYLSESGYALYDSRGNTIMTDSIKYTFPILDASAKFALCYDLGGTSYSIYNTFAKLHTETLGYAITDGDISDAGAYVISTSTREYRTAVQLYDSDFKLISRVLREDYLCDVKYKADGSEVAIMTVGSQNGSFVSTIELVVPGKDSVRKSIGIDGYGYSLFYTESGFAVITDGGISFYDPDLNLIKAYAMTSSLVMSDCSDKYLTCVYTAGIIGNSYDVVIYDSTGRIVCEVGLNGKLAAVSHDESGEYVFILAGNNVNRINLVNRKLGSIPVDAGGFDVLPIDSDSFLLAMNNYALTCEPEDFAERYFDREASDTTNDQQ